MLSTMELPPDIWDEIFGHLSRPELANLAFLCRPILPLVQSRLYSSLNLNLAGVRMLANSSLHLLVHTRMLRLSYKHQNQNFSLLPAFFSALSSSGNLRSLTLVNQGGHENRSKPQVLGLLFGSMRQFLQSIHSLTRLSIAVNPPTSAQGFNDYQPFFEAALVHPALQSVSIGLWRLPRLNLTEGTISPPIRSLCVFLGIVVPEEVDCIRIFRHLDLTGLGELVLDLSFHSPENLPGYFTGNFAICSIKSLTIRAEYAKGLPTVVKILEPSESLSLHLYSYGSMDDFRNLMVVLADSLSTFTQASLSTLVVVIVCAGATSLSVVVSSEDWHLFRSAIKQFRVLSRVTIQLAGSSSDNIPLLNIQDQTRIFDAVKDGLSPSCVLSVFSAGLPKL
ncbi:hypothetical protein DL96DRAFT_1821822 [Flagelloscypha sp. PMI_526]|nr:hypothetical protein DL96DRAFT_1821822 [Flagelloscypha sp. PMI_526]